MKRYHTTWPAISARPIARYVIDPLTCVSIPRFLSEVASYDVASGICQALLLGSFSTAGQAACTLCDAGYKCPTRGEATQLRCNVGTYAFAGQDNCTECAAGTACPNLDGGASCGVVTVCS